MTIASSIIADSVSPEGKRLTTFQLRYPRAIHAEFMTHRMFSRNASSSRAIPVERLIQDVMDDPYIPTHWGKNQKGMQAGAEHNEMISNGTGMCYREGAWLTARDNAVFLARGFAKAGYHKQIVNRLLEPFAHINVVVTATEWANFFHLRNHPDAEPHIHDLAALMQEQYESNTPHQFGYGRWHLPYIGEVDEYQYDYEDWEIGRALERLIQVSVARCARVSYLTHEGKETNHDDDIELYRRLVGGVPLHASPAEHQAYPDPLTPFGTYAHPELHGNFTGWIQYRKTLPGENFLYTQDEEHREDL